VVEKGPEKKFLGGSYVVESYADLKMCVLPSHSSTSYEQAFRTDCDLGLQKYPAQLKLKS
jgi:hypothetical protein